MNRRTRSHTGKIWLVAVLAGVMLVLVGVGTVYALQLTQQPSYSGYPPAKAKYLERIQHEMAEGYRAPKNPHYVPIPSSPTPTTPAPQAGIVDTHQGPFEPIEFIVSNFWQGPVGSNWVLVYAGATGNLDGNAGQGALRLYTENMQLIGIFKAPSGTSPVTITAVNGDLMYLHTDKGGSLIFNLQTHQYE